MPSYIWKSSAKNNKTEGCQTNNSSSSSISSSGSYSSSSSSISSSNSISTCSGSQQLASNTKEDIGGEFDFTAIE